MSLFRQKPVVIRATQWWKNGDHPDDGTDTFCKSNGKRYRREGKVVRYFRLPAVPGTRPCSKCQRTMHNHGWIDTLEAGYQVCPGDWILTDPKGGHYPMKQDIFEATYEPAFGCLERGAMKQFDPQNASQELLASKNLDQLPATQAQLRGLAVRLYQLEQKLRDLQQAKDDGRCRCLVTRSQ